MNLGDRIIFSAPKQNIEADDWLKTQLSELFYFTEAYGNSFPFIGKTVRLQKDGVDICEVSSSFVCFFSTEENEYKTSVPGNELNCKICARIKEQGEIEYDNNLRSVCHNGFEEIFFPSMEMATEYSIKHKMNTVCFNETTNSFMNVFYDFRSIVERLCSSLILLDSKFQICKTVENCASVNGFLEELLYIQRTKVKKKTRAFDLIEGILLILRSRVDSCLLLDAAFDVIKFIKELIGKEYYDSLLNIIRIYIERLGLPCVYFQDYNVMKTMCDIIRSYESQIPALVKEISNFMGSCDSEDTSQNNETYECDVRFNKTKKDPIRTLSKQAKISMWYAEVSKNNGNNPSCSICGKELQSFDDFEVDHVFPWSKGGKTNPDNLQVLCKECNRRKGSK